jgi:hypothetical protein
MNKDEFETLRNNTRGLGALVWNIWDYDVNAFDQGALDWYKFNLRKLYQKVFNEEDMCCFCGMKHECKEQK